MIKFYVHIPIKPNKRPVTLYTLGWKEAHPKENVNDVMSQSHVTMQYNKYNFI